MQLLAEPCKLSERCLVLSILSFVAPADQMKNRCYCLPSVVKTAEELGLILLPNSSFSSLFFPCSFAKNNFSQQSVTSIAYLIPAFSSTRSIAQVLVVLCDYLTIPYHLGARSIVTSGIAHFNLFACSRNCWPGLVLLFALLMANSDVPGFVNCHSS